MSKQSVRGLSLLWMVLFATSALFAQDSSHQLPENFLANAHAKFLSLPPHVNRDARNTNGTPGVDSLTNWNGSYQAPGFDPSGKYRHTWYYNMVGNPPQRGGTTTINAPVVPVELQLLNADGSVAYTYDPKPVVAPTMSSPLFQNATFSSSPTPTQVTDAIMRAEFWNTMAPDWHTMLAGSVKTTRTMAVPYGYYYYQLKKNGKCCEYVSDRHRRVREPVVPGDRYRHHHSDRGGGTCRGHHDQGRFVVPVSKHLPVFQWQSQRVLRARVSQLRRGTGRRFEREQRETVCGGLRGPG